MTRMWVRLVYTFIGISKHIHVQKPVRSLRATNVLTENHNIAGGRSGFCELWAATRALSKLMCFESKGLLSGSN